jgi:hypothetical protein
VHHKCVVYCLSASCIPCNHDSQVGGGVNNKTTDTMEGAGLMKSKFTLGLTIGATVGGLISLYDAQTRHHVRGSLMRAGSETMFYLRNPGVFVDDVKTSYAKVATSLSTTADKGLRGVEEVQHALQKVSKLDDQLELPAGNQTKQLAGSASAR